MKDVKEIFPKIISILDQYHQLWNGKRMDFHADSFDAVNSKASLSKLVKSSWEQTISELVRVTKPGGTWYIAPPYMLGRLKDEPEQYQKVVDKGIDIVTWDWGWQDPRNHG